jgi:hypothetical protein
MIFMGANRSWLSWCWALVCCGLVLGQNPKPLAVDDVVAMLEAKLPEQVILTRIKAHGQPFNLSTADLQRLQKAGATEKVMVLMLDPSAGAATTSPASGATPPASAAESGPFKEIGVYFKKGAEWQELLPEVVNWKTGGVLKNIASAGVVKKDINGNLPGPHSRNSVTSPLEFMIYAPEGVAITEYQLLRLRAKSDYREFRTVTGGVFNTKSGAMRDMVPFEGKKAGTRLYSVVLPNNLGAGEYGFIHLGASGGAGGLTSLSMGKMYTFRLLE